MERCFHCNETVPPGTDCTLEMHGERRLFCCPGCRAVAELIGSAGLERFYEFRSAPSIRATARADGERPWTVCDRPEVRQRLLRADGRGLSELRFRADGINCAACSWLLERGVGAIDGVDEVSVNPIMREVLVRLDPARVPVSAILSAAEGFGFEPQLGAGDAAEAERNAARAELKRLAVAGLGFAQVMTLSAALYLGAFKAMEASFTSFFVLASMLIATPVVLYAGAPIFRSAIADLARGRVGMDVPVSLAIAAALAASLINTFRGQGHVWFDSATMFVFFLTLGRFLEARARHRAGSLVGALAELRPLAALRRRGDSVERVGTVELDVGDVVVVGPGEALPADGELLSPAATLDESLLSGESLGQRRSQGDAVLGGSLNLGSQPLEFRVTQAGADGYIDRVGDLLHRAMADRPEFLRVADRWARWFVASVLAATGLTGAMWLAIAPERAFEVVLAMLVVTCPCALSLAAPTVYAVALGRLARLGLLCRSARVLERLGAVTTWLFDKTGTLTEGRIGVLRVETFAAADERACLRIAAALEAGIEHPVAHALAAAAAAPPAQGVEYRFGYGVTGRIDGRDYRLGSARHVGVEPADELHCVYLADDSGVLARFVLADRLRPHARDALATLASDAAVTLVSGDAPGQVRETAAALGIERFAALQSPADKLDGLRMQQAAGEVVAAVGDGINDAPLLAQADVSIAMVSGSRLAQAGADIVFTGKDLRTLARLPALARAARAVVRQNLGWAVAYNVCALPLAASGVLSPWMAALGMSLSSLVVVGNALQLHRRLDATAAAADGASADTAPVEQQAGT